MSIHDETTEQKKDLVFYDDDDVDSVRHAPDEQASVTIERQEPNNSESLPQKSLTQNRDKWRWTILGIFASVVLCMSMYCGWRLYCYYYHIGVPVSVSSEENITKLAKPYAHDGKPDIVLSSDSIFGVALNMYELKNLKAEISLTEPDSTDTSVWMYSRSADHTSDNKYIGSLVMQGRELSTDNSRLGYCAMANGNIVIGISRSDKVKDYAMEQGGSFFRQFILVSNGVLPSKFHLHGKVERCALARMSDDRLFYIESRHPETMWDFADALREYGFADAIYITGGKCHSFYRTADGKPHSIGDMNQHPHPEYKKIVPWLVFKAR